MKWSSGKIIKTNFLPLLYRNHKGELLAHLQALNCVSPNSNQNNKVAICIDQFQSIHSSMNIYTDNPLVQDIHDRNDILANSEVTVNLIWFSAIVGIAGNWTSARE